MRPILRKQNAYLQYCQYQHGLIIVIVMIFGAIVSIQLPCGLAPPLALSVLHVG